MQEPSKLLEVWGGLECTIARIGHAYRDQIRETGHRDRIDDLDAIRDLGLRTLRYPILLEAVAPDHPDHCDWQWSDQRMARLQSLGIRPIVGLLHHGSGPRYTSLLDPHLPEILARHAERVAARYPWVDLYTPVNEPLTTARFSALYGHWYPHQADLGSFVRAVVLQCKAVMLAMQVVRKVNPQAKLVQTEDVGKTFGTPALTNQADHENIRRWLSLDLLCGRLDQHHCWYGFLQRLGVTESDLAFFLDCCVSPDIIGINHYLTSERFLDEAVERYPAALRGGNGPQIFADAEAVRVAMPPGVLGPAARLTEVWERYQRPLAITEVHHGCTRDEQLRWLAEVWNAAGTVRAAGADVRAVTIWALMGTYDWNSLLTETRGFYEPGAFDVRAPRPRQTALGRAVRDLVAKGRFDHAVLDGPGWWHRPERLYAKSRDGVSHARPRRKLALTRADAPLTRVFTRICAARGLSAMILDTSVPPDAAALHGLGVWAVIDTGAMAARTDADFAATSLWARACAMLDLPWVGFSSDHVFDGCLGRPYSESDQVSPADPEAEAAWHRERALIAAHAEALLIRTGRLIDVEDEENTVTRLFRALASGRSPKLPVDILSYAYAPDFAHAVLDLLIDGETGLWHLVNQGATGMPDLAARLAGSAGFRALPARTGESIGRARNRALESRRGSPMPSLEDALGRFIQDMGAVPATGSVLAAE